MASNRWVAIDPDILTHPLVGAGQAVSPADPARGAYSRMEAWVWIICNASFADHAVYNRGRKMTLQRGDLLGAWAFLAHTFNWSAKTVRIWIEKLIEDNMLQRRALEEQKALNGDQNDVPETYWGNQSAILSIVNYWRFQFDEACEGQPRGNQKGNQEGDQQGNQQNRLSASKLADKYVLQQQQGQPIGQPEGQPKGQHITSTITTVESNNNPLSEASSDDMQLILGDKPETKPKGKRKRRSTFYSEAFEVFWVGYPDRTNNSKPKAFEEWERLPEPDQNAAVASLPGFASYCRKKPDYQVLHAERYLRDRRWESFLASAQSMPWWKDQAQIAKLNEDRWRSGIDRYANGIWDIEKLGPPPGHAECIVPVTLIDELNLAEIYTDKGIRRR
jgi:hypothetical protein